jgi:predicted Rossmann fold nucleotide-binding protein DprA/Smf involved in DNA uptake
VVVHGIGNRAIVRQPEVGLICSVQCPGSVVIKAFDAVRMLRDAGVVVAGGFHSPMEKECLEFLLRGKQPVIVAPARGLTGLRLPPAWRSAVDASQLLVASPFGDEVRRTTRDGAAERNKFVAALAKAVLIPYASPGGKAEAIARGVTETGTPLFTFADDENENLYHLGARPFDIGAFSRYQGE